MKRFSSWLLLFIVVSTAGFGCARPVSNTNPSTDPAQIDRQAILDEARTNGLIMTAQEVERMHQDAAQEADDQKLPAPNANAVDQLNVQSWRAAALADVTANTSFGLAHATVENGVFTLVAKMGGLPVLPDGFQYHGWLVQRADPMRVIDLGTATLVGDRYLNIYRTTKDVSAFDFYVLTKQPNDVTTPREHILEGTLR